MKQSKYIYHTDHDYRPVSYSRHTVKSSPSWGFMIILFVLLVIALAYFFPQVVNGHALGENQASGYLTWNNATVTSEITSRYQAYVYPSRVNQSGKLPHYAIPEIDYVKQDVSPSQVVTPHKKHNHKHEASGNNTSVNSQDTGNNSQVSEDQSDSKPHEKECKNKNSGKDGTPNERNAGGGQEKHSSSIALGLYILLMKAYKSKDDCYVPLARKDKIATFDNLFAMRRYLRRYDKSLLYILKV